MRIQRILFPAVVAVILASYLLHTYLIDSMLAFILSFSVLFWKNRKSNEETKEQHPYGRNTLESMIARVRAAGMGYQSSRNEIIRILSLYYISRIGMNLPENFDSMQKSIAKLRSDYNLKTGRDLFSPNSRKDHFYNELKEAIDFVKQR